MPAITINFANEGEDVEFQDVTVNGTLTTSNTVNAETNIVDQLDVEDDNQNLQFRIDGDATTPFMDLKENEVRNMSVVKTAGAGGSTIDFQDAANSDQTLLKLTEGGPVEVQNAKLELNGNIISEVGGTTDASSGAIRMANAQPIQARNAGDTTDIRLIGTNSSDEILLGLNATTITHETHTFLDGNTLREVGGTTDASTGAIRLAAGSLIGFASNASNDTTTAGIDTHVVSNVTEVRATDGAGNTADLA